MAVIQQIGSYAGLAAIVGLAVLAGLYFSQARDVKRLREWAGRAPERAPVAYQQPYRAPAQPVRQQPPPRPPVPPGASPGAQPAPAQAAAAGATPAVAAGPLAATPAAARAAEGASALTQSTPAPSAPRQTLPPRTAPPGLGGHFAREAELARAKEEAERAAGVDPEQDEDELDQEDADPVEDDGAGAEDGHPESAWADGEPDSEGEDLEDEDGELDGEDYDQESGPDAGALPDPEDFHEGDDLVGDPGTGDRLVDDQGGGDQRTVAPPVRPPPPPITAARRPLPPRPAPPPRTGQAPLIPPYAQSRPDGGTWENRKLSPAKAGLAVAATVVVVGAAAFGVLQLTGKSDSPKKPAKPATPAAGDQPAGRKKGSAPAGIDPRSVTVSVLNGTTVGGLAAQLGDKLERQGFQLGNVTNNTDQQRAESVVLFAPGAEKEAREVGRRLKINQREPIDPDSQTRAGDATVVVVTGADLNK